MKIAHVHHMMHYNSYLTNYKHAQLSLNTYIIVKCKLVSRTLCVSLARGQAMQAGNVQIRLC